MEEKKVEISLEDRLKGEEKKVAILKRSNEISLNYIYNLGFRKGVSVVKELPDRGYLSEVTCTSCEQYPDDCAGFHKCSDYVARKD